MFGSSKNTDIVTLTGNQTIRGHKTFALGINGISNTFLQTLQNARSNIQTQIDNIGNQVFQNPVLSGILTIAGVRTPNIQAVNSDFSVGGFNSGYNTYLNNDKHQGGHLFINTRSPESQVYIDGNLNVEQYVGCNNLSALYEVDTALLSCLNANVSTNITCGGSIQSNRCQALDVVATHGMSSPALSVPGSSTLGTLNVTHTCTAGTFVTSGSYSGHQIDVERGFIQGRLNCDSLYVADTLSVDTEATIGVLNCAIMESSGSCTAGSFVTNGLITSNSLETGSINCDHFQASLAGYIQDLTAHDIVVDTYITCSGQVTALDCTASTINGSTSITSQGTLSVDGDSTFHNINNTNITSSGNCTANHILANASLATDGTLSVGGSSTLTDITVSGNADVHDITVSGSIDIQGNLSVSSLISSNEIFSIYLKGSTPTFTENHNSFLLPTQTWTVIPYSIDLSNTLATHVQISFTFSTYFFVQNIHNTGTATLQSIQLEGSSGFGPLTLPVVQSTFNYTGAFQHSNTVVYTVNLPHYWTSIVNPIDLRMKVEYTGPTGIEFYIQNGHLLSSTIDSTDMLGVIETDQIYCNHLQSYSDMTSDGSVTCQDLTVSDTIQCTNLEVSGNVYLGLTASPGTNISPSANTTYHFYDGIISYSATANHDVQAPLFSRNIQYAGGRYRVYCFMNNNQFQLCTFDFIVTPSNTNYYVLSRSQSGTTPWIDLDFVTGIYQMNIIVSFNNGPNKTSLTYVVEEWISSGVTLT
jgi:hypothetical protein